MKDIWRPLLDVLDETLALYKQLLVLSEEKRKVLIEAQHIALEEITRREAPLVLEGSRLEERRAKATAALAINYQLANQKPTISELAAVAEPEVSEYLYAFNDDLGGTTQELVRLNLLNAGLIKQGLTFVNYNMKDILGRVEEIFKEPSDTGLQSALDNFWNAWQSLAVNAADSGSRSVVRQRGVELVDAIQRAETGLNNITTDVNSSLNAKVKNLNQYLTELAAVNKQILASPSDSVNALKDQQDLLVEKIAYLAKIQTTKEATGSVNVSIGGINVVTRDQATLFNTDVGTSGNLRIAGTGMEVVIGTEGGELQGLLDARDSASTWGVQSFLDKLGTMSQFLLNDFNAIHRSGFGLDNKNNVNFFGSTNYGSGEGKIGTTLQQVSSTALGVTGSTPIVTAATTLTLSDGTNSMTVALQVGWTVDQVAEAINAQAQTSSVNVRAAYDATQQKFQLFTTGESKTLTATEPVGSSFLSNVLKLAKPTAAYWLDALEVNPAILTLDGLNYIAAKTEQGKAGLTETEVKSSNIWRGNSAGGAMTATASGNYTFDPKAMPIRVRISGLTTNPDGTKAPAGLEYSTDGATWTAAAAGSTAKSFQFTIQGATVKMSIADNAANNTNDIYVVTLPPGNEGNASGDNAVRLAELLKVTPSTTLGNASLDGFYNNFIGTLGVQSQNAQYASANNDALVSQAKTMRDAVSGVNLDEELTAMIKYQKGYNGCARMLTAMDEMLDKLINNTGVIGR